MKTYQGVVVQRCYIDVEVVMDDDATLDDVSRYMQEVANTDKGCWESDALDIVEVENENE